MFGKGLWRGGHGEGNVCKVQQNGNAKHFGQEINVLLLVRYGIDKSNRWKDVRICGFY